MNCHFFQLCNIDCFIGPNLNINFKIYFLLFHVRYIQQTIYLSYFRDRIVTFVKNSIIMSLFQHFQTKYHEILELACWNQEIYEFTYKGLQSLYINIFIQDWDPSRKVHNNRFVENYEKKKNVGHSFVATTNSMLIKIFMIIIISIIGTELCLNNCSRFINFFLYNLFYIFMYYPTYKKMNF